MARPKGIPSHRKGITLKEEYGFEKSKEIIKNLSESHEGQCSWCEGKNLSEKHKDNLKKGWIKRKEKGLGVSWNKGKRMIHSGSFKKGHEPLQYGENHWNWNGGTSFEHYDKKWSNKFKRLIRKRDNQVCMLCGIHREKLSRALDVHHLNYDKKLTIPENCISLCISCHMKTNKNRKQWTPFFQNLLLERYGYLYENKKPIINLGVE